VTDLIASLDSVHFSYDRGNEVLTNVTLQLERGSIYVLRGKNGAGKSTLVGLLTGRLAPTSGTVTLAGGSAPSLRRSRSACVFQQLSLFQDLTVTENLLLAAVDGSPWRAWTKASARAMARRHCGKIGIDLPLDAVCGSLSFPARQKLEIARALMRRPSVLFLDEPTSALDSAARTELFGVLRRVNANGTTVVLVTHNAEDVAALRGRAIDLDGGRVVERKEGLPSRSGQSEVLEGADLKQAPAGPSESDGGSAMSAPRGTVPSMEIEIASLTLNNTVLVKLYPRHPSVMIFDDAVHRSQAVAALHEARSDYSVRLRDEPGGEWRYIRSGADEGIRVMSTDKEQHSLFAAMSVQENASLLALRRSCTAMRSPAEEGRLVDRIEARAGISWPGRHAPVGTLSGGNQQRLILASLLEARPRLLVAEEPLMGLDEPSHDTIAGLLLDHTASSRNLLIATCFPDHYHCLGARAGAVMHHPRCGPKARPDC